VFKPVLSQIEIRQSRAHSRVRAILAARRRQATIRPLWRGGETRQLIASAAARLVEPTGRPRATNTAPRSALRGRRVPVIPERLGLARSLKIRKPHRRRTHRASRVRSRTPACRPKPGVCESPEAGRKRPHGDRFEARQAAPDGRSPGPSPNSNRAGGSGLPSSVRCGSLGGCDLATRTRGTSPTEMSSIEPSRLTIAQRISAAPWPRNRLWLSV
jgi:hypothetical protein